MVAAVTAAGVALSVAVETLQLLTTNRVSSVSDVTTNGVGALAGVLVAEEARRRFVALLHEHGSSRWVANGWSYTALSALVVLVIAAWQPFDLTLDVGDVGGKLRDLLRDPWQRGPLTDEGNAVVLYALEHAGDHEVARGVRGERGAGCRPLQSAPGSPSASS